MTNRRAFDRSVVKSAVWLPSLAILFLLGACGGTKTVTHTVRSIHTVHETVTAVETKTVTRGRAATTGGAGAGAQRQVFTPYPRGGLSYEPRRIDQEDSESGYISDIRWTRYGGPTAVGKGFSPKRRPVTIRLKRIGRCAGKPAYKLWSLNGSEFSPIMSAHTEAAYR